MKEFIILFIGGGIGSATRYYLGRWVQSWHPSPLPIGTLAANILACAALGFIISLADQKQSLSASARLFWAVGFCGGFSTFSTFSAETLQLFQKGIHTTGLLYIFLSVVLCLAATLAGLYIGQKV